ncbi:cyclase family protein [Virgibacillus kimchii]
MTIQIIDLSVPMDNNSQEPFPPDISYMNHSESVNRAANAFGIAPENWPEGKAWATEKITLSTHTGTHIDAPYHYWFNTGNKPAKTVDQLPLDWFFGNGVVLDFTWKEPGTEITMDEIIQELKRINHKLKPKEIVLIRTGSDKNLYSPDYAETHPGMSAAATRFLIHQGIKVMGTDAYGWDTPFKVQAEQYKKTGDPNIIWAAHYVGKELEYCQIEKLANLDRLPSPNGFKIAAFPVNISQASGAWARPVAIIGL